MTANIFVRLLATMLVVATLAGCPPTPQKPVPMSMDAAVGSPAPVASPTPPETGPLQLCTACAGLPLIKSVGTCRACGAATPSGELRRCAPCATRDGRCARCERPR